jgi:hypothetical protein
MSFFTLKTEMLYGVNLKNGRRFILPKIQEMRKMTTLIRWVVLDTTTGARESIFFDLRREAFRSWLHRKGTRVAKVRIREV